MSPRPPETPDELVRMVGFADLIGAVVARRRWVAWLSAAGLLIGVALAIFLPPRFTSETRIVGMGSSHTSLMSSFGGLSSVAGLAGDLGLSLGGAGTLTSPQFYVDLLQSREIRETLLRTPFPVRGDSTRRVRLLDQLDIRGGTDALRLDNGVRYLERRTSVTAAEKSGIVAIKVTLPEPQLAADVTNRLIELLNTFNLERLQFQSRQQRIFAERRLREAQGELRAAEQEELAFAERNRSITNSPALKVEAAGLQRAIETKQTVYNTLSRSYEEARIAEAKDVPTLTVIDRAEPPARRSQPLPWLLVVIGLASGLLLGMAAAIGWDMLRRARATLGRTNVAAPIAERPAARPSEAGAAPWGRAAGAS